MLHPCMDLKITHYPIGDLISAEYNPRQLTADQFNQLKDSVKRFGLVDPIIVNTHKERKNVVVGGHQRLKVAQALKISKIPCVEVELPLDKERELNVRLNKNTGEWDWDTLANMFDVKELTGWGFNEKSLVGFSDIDYSVLDDVNLDEELETLKDGTRRALQIEFKLEDWEEAYSILQEMRKKSIYVGGLILEFLKAEAE